MLVQDNLVQYQSLTTGLFPIFSNGSAPPVTPTTTTPGAGAAAASSSTQNKTNVGYVRDTIYCAISIWSLRQCYTKVDSDQGRTYQLGQIAVKSMRGILFCWMRQAHKMEKFKVNPSPENALHSKFDITTGDEIQDDLYGHLQIDCVSLYLITLAQMINSGLQVCIYESVCLLLLLDRT